MRDAEFHDPRLLNVYDAEYSWGPDDAFFSEVVNEVPRSRVLDLGCGTGRLALALAADGHDVTGIDPSAAALAAARRKPGAERVRWVHGTASAAQAAAFDTAIMTGHVAQFMSDDVWEASMRQLRRAMAPAGRLAFSVYDPRVQVWRRWRPDATSRYVTLADGGGVAISTALTNASSDAVSYSIFYTFSSGERLRSDSTLHVRTEQDIRRVLNQSGFAVERVHGGWCGEPVGAAVGELVFVARVVGSCQRD